MRTSAEWIDSGFGSKIRPYSMLKIRDGITNRIGFGMYYELGLSPIPLVYSLEVFFLAISLYQAQQHIRQPEFLRSEHGIILR